VSVRSDRLKSNRKASDAPTERPETVLALSAPARQLSVRRRAETRSLPPEARGPVKVYFAGHNIGIPEGARALRRANGTVLYMVLKTGELFVIRNVGGQIQEILLSDQLKAEVLRKLSPEFDARDRDAAPSRWVPTKLTGTLPVACGRRVFYLDPSSEVRYRGHGDKTLAYVRFRGLVHILSVHGELLQSAQQMRDLAKRFEFLNIENSP